MLDSRLERACERDHTKGRNGRYSQAVNASPISGIICASFESCSSRTWLAFCRAGRSTGVGFEPSACRVEVVFCRFVDDEAAKGRE
jgi:hypothetical protein